MRLLPISMVHPGMKLGKPIVSEEGQTMLSYHSELSLPDIRKLKLMGFQQLHIDDPRTEDIRITDAVREETSAAVRHHLMPAFQRLQQSGDWNSGDMRSLSQAALQSMKLIVEDLQEQNRQSPEDDSIWLMHTYKNSLSILDQLCQNALNVCVYATRIGIVDGYGHDDLYAFGLGGMLHDIGNTQVSPKLLLKTAPLTPLEYEEIQKHTEYGYKIVKDAPDIPLLSAHCTLQHHEKINGSGYPAGLTKAGIHPFAQWIGLLDAYDAMTNPRPYRPAFSPEHALENLFTRAGTLYDREKVDSFRSRAVIYPVGLSVRLSTGQIGIVSKHNPSFKHRPVVRILTNEQGQELLQPVEIDLSRHLHIRIYRIGEDALVH
ncbi:HD-GYP domain-containing protein [Paenibacillus sp. OAS669]|uniref:HD-GYP domain-containing protein n=1 Tax=Paenibacillus sp. OAS669 TaxID=2663821 RepID=UPI00178BB9AB|nr:HD-GYP domain-containing protein [Paenibacillus sp. OAS669]MBE1443965.1 HD-GYP domain-containing protein (c-di-GMP phosphodiesterase class II) [Paenibacillus sp. OAS669]